MFQYSQISEFRPSLLKALTCSAGAVFIGVLNVPPNVSAQGLGMIDPTQILTWAQGAIDHAREMHIFKDAQFPGGAVRHPGIQHRSRYQRTGCDLPAERSHPDER